MQKELDNAPIIYINPSEFEGEEIKLVAKNINDFFGLLCFVKETEYFRENLKTKEELDQVIQDNLIRLKEDGTDPIFMDEIFRKFLNKNKTDFIKNPILYISDLNKDTR